MKKYSTDFAFRSDCYYYEIYLHPGKYFFEAWGASGGDAFDGRNHGGYGAMASGFIEFDVQTTLYALIGGKGENYSLSSNKTAGGCGGGGKGGSGYKRPEQQYANGAGGGGSTTVMINSTFLENRIIVSAGGSGAAWLGNGSPAGAISSSDVSNRYFTTKGANQTFGFLPGIGADGRDAGGWYDRGSEGGSGAGSGYFGGTTINNTGNHTDLQGSGGSSYISGHEGCSVNTNAIFRKTKLISGDELMNLPSNLLRKGNPGNGHLRITFIPPECTVMNHYTPKINIFYLAVFILMFES